MKRTIFVVVSVFMMLGCGTTGGNMNHSIDTQVVLSQANFQVVSSAQGSATAFYILGFGPSKSDLYSRARSELVRNANLMESDKSKALINVTTDINNKYFWLYLPWYFSKTVSVSADIVEFK